MSRVHIPTWGFPWIEGCFPACWGSLNPVQTSRPGCGHGCGREHHQLFPVALRAGLLSELAASSRLTVKNSIWKSRAGTGLSHHFLSPKLHFRPDFYLFCCGWNSRLKLPQRGAKKQRYMYPKMTCLRLYIISLYHTPYSLFMLNLHLYFSR